MITSILYLSGCSYMGKGTEEVSIRASSPNAIITVNGEYKGKGTAKVVLPTNQDAIIVAQEGKKSAYVLLHPKRSEFGELDYQMKFIFPIGTLIANETMKDPGAWELNYNSVYLSLD